jgi:phosphoadenosine phosphosulfate reductase
MKDAVELITKYLSYSKAPCVTSSFQIDGVVLLDLVRRIAPGIPVLLVDTAHLFPETHAFGHELAARWGLNVVTLRAKEPRIGLWQRDSNMCCTHNKVAPLFEALQGHDIWFAALRREQSPSRAALEEVARFVLPCGHVLKKISPLARWSGEAIWDYVRSHDLPIPPLHAAGYTSVGCVPCTSRPADLSDPRSGRWRGERRECGIHVAAR